MSRQIPPKQPIGFSISSVIGLCMALFLLPMVAYGAPFGATFQLPAGTSSPRPAIADDGSFVVGYSDTSNFSQPKAFVQRYNADGTVNSTPFEPRSTNVATEFDTFKSIATAPNGDFVVVWNRATENSSNGNLFARRFNADGSPNGNEFLVTPNTVPSFMTASVSVAGNGSFVIVRDNGFNSIVSGQRFDNTGAPQGSSFLLDPGAADPQNAPVVATDSSGNFVCVWERGSTLLLRQLNSTNILTAPTTLLRSYEGLT